MKRHLQHQMNLLTQEQAKSLKPGDVVLVYWFTPRKPKERPDSPTREFGGRTEYMEYVFEHTVDSYPWESTSDGLVLKLKGQHGVYCVNRMEKSARNS